MEKVVTATEARIHFGEMMRRAVEKQETIIVERDGSPVVVILSIDRYEQWRAAQMAQSTLDKLRQVQARIAAELGDRPLPPPEEIIRQMREERDAQLLDLP